MDMRTQYLHHLKEVKKRSDLTLGAYEKDLAQFAAYLSDTLAPSGNEDIHARLLSVTSETAEAYRQVLIEQGFGLSTIHRKLTVLRRFYAWLVKSGVLVNNPIPLPERPEITESPFCFFDPQEIERLFSVIPSGNWLGVRDRAILGILYNTGIRISELLAIKTGDFLWDEQCLQIGSRGKPSRRLILWDRVLEEVQHYDRLRAGTVPEGRTRFFVNRDGKPLSGRSVRRKLSAYGRQTELGVSVTPATLRHSCAMLMLQNGVSPRQVQDQLGHLSASSLRPYLDRLKERTCCCPGEILR